FGADTIDGGEGGDDRDVIDLSQVTGPVTVTFTGAEAGTFTDGTDTVAFSGIERFILTDQADVVDASNDTAGIEIVAGDGNDHVTGGTGDDTIAGDQGDDTISGGDGHDTIRGDRGADSIDGGDGDDSLAGGLDDDTLEGGLGDDTLNGGGGADGLVGGAGRDSIEGSSGNDTIRAGDGDDVVKGGNDDDVIFGGAGADRMQGDDGADSLSGDDGDDTISGGEGADTLSGEEGADSLDGGSGGDVLAGGAGNDEITTGDGEDIVMLDVGGGDDVITDFDLGDDDGNGSFNDQLDVSALRDLNGDPIRAFDVTVTDDGFGNARLVFPAGESVVLRGVAPAQMSSASQMNAAGVPCFTAGTLIDTPTGPRPVDALRPGDLVETVDDGPQPVIWQATHTIAGDVLRGNPRLRPVRIEVGAFGNDRPLLVSPQHGILLRDDDGREALIRATHLARLDDGTATTPPVTGPVTYVHVMLARHQVLISHGMRSESFYPGPWALRGLDPVTRAHLLAIFPALAEVAVDVAYGPTARPFLTWQELLALRMPGASMIPRQMPNATPDHRPAWLPAAAWSIRTNRATPAIRPGDPEPQVSMCRTRTSGRGSTAPDEPFLGAIGR
ncbi:MAG: Hint domain-containing protein, partial [Pseudomonadota bacterium]